MTPKPPKALRVSLGVVAALCLATTITHVLMVFLHVAPSNPISQRFNKQIDAWIHPLFAQSWSFFAPDPASDNAQIFARTGWTTASGGKRVSDWFDITAVDKADTRHNPFPSHTTQNMLQASWEFYQDSHDDDDAPSGDDALIREKYLRNLAVQRVAASRPHPFQVIQLKVITQPIAPPDAGRKAKNHPPDPDIRVLPWWNVTPDGS